MQAADALLRQEKFCDLFVNSDREMFGNGVQCYLEVYDIDRSKPNWYKTACSAASRLLGNVKVIAKIKELLETGGFNDENVQKQHLFLIDQYTDLGVKQRAISDYYKLKGNYAPEKTDLTSLGEQIQGLTIYVPRKDGERVEAKSGGSGKGTSQ